MRICLPRCRLEIDSGPKLLLGPFRQAHSLEDAHRQAIAGLIHAPTVLVAAVDDQIVGVLGEFPAGSTASPSTPATTARDIKGE